MRGWRTAADGRTGSLRNSPPSSPSAIRSSSRPPMREGQPYVQHRGGPAGFLRVLDERTLAFADYRGNRQYITLGNLAENDRAFLFLIDYANRRRIKIWGRARVVDDDPELIARLMPGRLQGEARAGHRVRHRRMGRQLPAAHPPHAAGRRGRGDRRPARSAHRRAGSAGGRRPRASARIAARMARSRAMSAWRRGERRQWSAAGRFQRRDRKRRIIGHWNPAPGGATACPGRDVDNRRRTT